MAWCSSSPCPTWLYWSSSGRAAAHSPWSAWWGEGGGRECVQWQCLTAWSSEERRNNSYRNVHCLISEWWVTKGLIFNAVCKPWGVGYDLYNQCYPNFQTAQSWKNNFFANSHDSSVNVEKIDAGWGKQYSEIFSMHSLKGRQQQRIEVLPVRFIWLFIIILSHLPHFSLLDALWFRHPPPPPS